MRYPRKAPYKKLDYALFVAAALAYLMIQQRDAVGLYLFDESVRMALPARSRRSWLRRLFLAMEPYRDAAPAPLGSQLALALHAVAERLKRRSLLVLLSDGFVLPEAQAAFQQALARLRFAGHEVLFIRIWDEKTEKNFQLPLEPLRLVDIETRREVKIHPLEMQSTYQAHFAQWEAQLQRFCMRHRIDWVAVDMEESFFAPLKRYLLKRQRLP